MTNQLALWLFAGIFAGTVIVGQLMHISPTGEFKDGVRLLLMRVFGVYQRVWTSIWFLEFAKNFFQACLFGGPSAVNIASWKMQLTEETQLRSLVIGLIASAVLLAVTTRQLEGVRAEQANTPPKV